MKRYKSCKIRVIFCLVTGLFLTASAAAADIPFRTVQKLFAAIAEADAEEISVLVTADFELLEVGEIWDLEKTLAEITPTAGKFTRRNYFHRITSEEMGDTAWVSYWNRATFTSAQETRERSWLESAVLVRRDGEWKVRMLHSTRLEEGQLPQSVTLEEYVPGSRAALP